ncbi:hypothetical protein LTR08_003104 [Meristemomyces frigidus]|nr:hypothetical protein LTR08_003104 [Meristemomyces frigidus]
MAGDSIFPVRSPKPSVDEMKAALQTCLVVQQRAVDNEKQPFGAALLATCYWANIGRIVYGASEERLAELTGQGNEKNMTLAMPCRKVLEGSQKDIEIIGPVDETVVVHESDRYWKPLRDAKGKEKI